MDQALQQRGYTVIEKLGHGSPVYLVESIDKKNASGIINPLEIDIPARLSHPYIVQNLTILSKYRCIKCPRERNFT